MEIYIQARRLRFCRRPSDHIFEASRYPEKDFADDLAIISSKHQGIQRKTTNLKTNAETDRTENKLKKD